MTCPDHQYSDRAQLQALGSLFADDAGQPGRLALARHMGSTAPASTPAPITGTPPNSGEPSDMIASRCRKMQFRSNVARERFLSVHAILSRGR